MILISLNEGNKKCPSPHNELLNLHNYKMFDPLTHSARGVVSIRGGVAEEHSDLIHRHRLHLLPAHNTHQQLVEFQLMGVSEVRAHY